jgi:hypothetical protein
LDGIETTPEEAQAILRYVAEKPAKFVETAEPVTIVESNKKKKKVTFVTYNMLPIIRIKSNVSLPYKKHLPNVFPDLRNQR